MTLSRRAVFRYGVPVDLVILAIAVGLLYPGRAWLLITSFIAAVALSSWKGGWRSAITAIALSFVSLLAIFGDTVSGSQVVLFLAAGFVVASLIQTAVAARQQFGEAVAAAEQEEPDSELGDFEDRDLVRNHLPISLAGSGLFMPEAAPSAPLVDEAAPSWEAGEAAPVSDQTVTTPVEVMRTAEGTGRKRDKRKKRRKEAERAAAMAAATAAPVAQASSAAAPATPVAGATVIPVPEPLAAEPRVGEQQRDDAERAAIERDAAERLARERDAAARLEEEGRAAREEAQRVAAERERIEREAEERLARERETAARLAAEREAAEQEARRLTAERERIEREAEEKLARERETAARLAAEREAAEQEAQRLAAEREELQRESEEKLAREKETAARLEAEKQAAAEEARRLAEERAALISQLEEARAAVAAAASSTSATGDLEQRLAAEREKLRRELEEKIAQETAARAEAERIAFEQRLAEERAALEREFQQRLQAEKAAVAAEIGEITASRRPSSPALMRPSEPSPSILGWVSGLFGRGVSGKTVNLKTNRIASNGTASRRPVASTPSTRKGSRPEPQPRVVFYERRRGTADTAVPRLRQKNIQAVVVERLIDAIDEISRMRPDAFFLDADLPDFEKDYKSLAQYFSNVPIFITGRSAATLPASDTLRYAAFVIRPYDVDELVQIAREARREPERFLAMQTMSRPVAAKVPSTPRPIPGAPPPTRPAPFPRPAAATAASSTPVPAAPGPLPRLSPSGPIAMPADSDDMSSTAEPLVMRASEDGSYRASCFHCRTPFDAMEADWCSCLTKERTLVCTNCLACFCKAPPAYKEKFWLNAPPTLFERKTAEARRSASLPPNPQPEEVTRPLVLAVEDDEEIQHIVNRVCTNLGYGYIYALNGQDGLNLARLYRPNLILSDAFMPKLDGREMCRLLKEEPTGADCKMIVMTGLYTDTKYRSEALKRFHVDDYLSKPVAITELINLLQKHLEGVAGLPAQEDLHELHRREIAADDENDITLAEMLATGEETELEVGGGAADAVNREQPRLDQYEVCCFNCGQMFDATTAEWCSCVGRDNTLLCPHCQTCFCKAPAAYRERFWIDAPPSLFERKMLGSKRQISLRSNPLPEEVKRPLILLVEDDENVQLIVRTVVTTMGFGFIVGANGQEGLSLARDYAPDLILSDAFMPKLDGREMCRLLKQDPSTARAKAIIMTGLYTDRKYRNEALDYFKVDDYVAKPLAVDDLIKLFKKHLPQEVQQTM